MNRLRRRSPLTPRPEKPVETWRPGTTTMRFPVILEGTFHIDYFTVSMGVLVLRGPSTATHPYRVDLAFFNTTEIKLPTGLTDITIDLAPPGDPRRARLGVQREGHSNIYTITTDDYDTGYISAAGVYYQETDLPNVGPSVFDDYEDPYAEHESYACIKHQYPAPTDITGRPIEE